MDHSLEPEKREYIRVHVTLPVEFKFLGHRKDHPELGISHTGKTSNLSGGGMLLRGPLPDGGWIPKLLMEKIVVGVKFQLPQQDAHILALCRVAWIEGAEKGAAGSPNVLFGLKFREISSKDRDRIFEFILKDQMP